MTEQTVIITGGNANLGYECAKAIAQRGDGWHIVIAARDAARGQAAVAQVIAATGHRQIEALPLDLAALRSVRDFAAAFAARDLPPLRAVVCNAGIQTSTRDQRTADGFELTFGVNHLGHFLLVNLLLPHLARPARVVVVSSGTHDPGKTLARLIGIKPPRYTTAHELAYPPQIPGMQITQLGTMRYSTSKLCNLLFAYELVRRLEAGGKSGITVNAFDPGLMPGTGLARDYGAVRRFFWHNIMPLMANRLPEVSTPARSGAALARLVVDPGLANATGKYYVIEKERPSSGESHDRAKAADLWATSLKLTGLTG
jgi:light-dependent protochlorophyllide reductase